MNIEMFKNELRSDIRKLQLALSALEDTDEVSEPITQPIAPPVIGSTVSPRKHRTLSPETKRKISMAMKDNWTHGRKKRTLSKAVRKKIATSQKARWAKQKVAAVTAAAAA